MIKKRSLIYRVMYIEGTAPLDTNILEFFYNIYI